MPLWLHFDPASGGLSGTPGPGDVGAVSLKLTAADPTGASVNNVLDINVFAPSLAHHVLSPDLSAIAINYTGFWSELPDQVYSGPDPTFYFLSLQHVDNANDNRVIFEFNIPSVPATVSEASLKIDPDDTYSGTTPTINIYAYAGDGC